MNTILKDTVQLNTIEEAIADIRQGKVIIVVDDENRENEGDFLAAAELLPQRLSILWQLTGEVLFVRH